MDQIEIENQLDEIKMYDCACKKSYPLLSTLFNHIRIKHNNDKEKYNKSIHKNGHPFGKKNTKRNSKKEDNEPDLQTQTHKKIYLCKCGRIFKTGGGRKLHIQNKHNDDQSYAMEKGKQGRHKKPQIENNISQQHPESNSYNNDESIVAFSTDNSIYQQYPESERYNNDESTAAFSTENSIFQLYPECNSYNNDDRSQALLISYQPPIIENNYESNLLSSFEHNPTFNFNLFDDTLQTFHHQNSEICQDEYKQILFPYQY